MYRRSSLRIALLSASIACAAAALPASALASGAQLTEPVPASVIVQANGLDWVWASPCAENGCTSGLLIGKDGFGFATAAEWALRPAVADFGGTKCASAWFDPGYDYCDYNDPDAGYFGSAPAGGLPSGPTGLDPMAGTSETWLVRASTAPPATPTVTGFTPASPSNSTTPSVQGTADTGSTVNLYTTSDCTGTDAATGSAADFAGPGLSVTVSPDQTTTLYATATNTNGQVSACSGGLAYAEDSTVPATPVISATDPASPANDNSVVVIGSAETGSTVRLYTTADCSGPSAASGSSDAFASPGITVGVADDSSSAFRATATDAAGNVSACSAAVPYVEDSTAPAAPTLRATNPASPADDNHPAITGSAEAGSTVRMYAAGGCTGDVKATGTAATLASPGLTATVADNSQTTFSATSTDAAGNRSSCSAPITYTERTAPTAPPATTPPTTPARDTVPPTSTIGQISRTQQLSRRITLRGKAAGTGSAVQMVRISLARLVGTQCRFLVEDGTFTKARSCARTSYMTAHGLGFWSLRIRKLAHGRYKVRSRAIDVAGNVERKDATRNLLRFRL